jgi:hypothetical protein
VKSWANIHQNNSLPETKEIKTPETNRNSLIFISQLKQKLIAL